MLLTVAERSVALPTLIDRAVAALSNARSAAEVLEARDLASVAYDAAKHAVRLLKAKQAHDDLISAAFRAQADALEIEAQAKRRLADEYDAAQERGEVKANGGDRVSTVTKQNSAPSASEIGLSRKDIHEAREVRDAEEAEPGIVRRTLDDAIDAGQEPTRAKVKRAVKAKSKRKRHPRPDRGPTDTQHDRDLRMLVGVWGAACESAREEFLTIINN